MERSSIVKNFILFSVVSLLALHVTVAQAQDKDPETMSSDASDSCTLEQE